MYIRCSLQWSKLDLFNGSSWVGLFLPSHPKMEMDPVSRTLCISNIPQKIDCVHVHDIHTMNQPLSLAFRESLYKMWYTSNIASRNSGIIWIWNPTTIVHWVILPECESNTWQACDTSAQCHYSGSGSSVFRVMAYSLDLFLSLS
jgi:hypothetical protein